MTAGRIESRLKELGYKLPVLPKSKGIYKRCVEVNGLIYVSGHISVNEDGSPISGKLGKDISEEDGIRAARQCGLAMIASLKEHLIDLDKIKRVVKILGMVNCVPEYEKHPVIMNGCSELFAAVWGEDNGIGARSAVGMGSLPGNVAVEVEAIFELK